MIGGSERRRRILVADDDRDHGEALGEVLGLRGFEVALVLGGREAIEALQGEAFDAAIIDVKMPGTSGFHVLRAALAAGVSAPIFLMSGFRLGQLVEYHTGRRVGLVDASGDRTSCCEQPSGDSVYITTFHEPAVGTAVVQRLREAGREVAHVQSVEAALEAGGRWPGVGVLVVDLGRDVCASVAATFRGSDDELPPTVVIVPPIPPGRPRAALARDTAVTGYLAKPLQVVEFLTVARAAGVPGGASW